MKICTLGYALTDEDIYFAESKRGKTVGKLGGYGGGEESEDRDLYATAVREFVEESGIDHPFSVHKIESIIDFFCGGEHIFECHLFFFRAKKMRLKETEEKHSPEKFSAKSMPLCYGYPWERMMPGDRLWFPHLLLGERFRAACHYNKDNTLVELFELRPL